MKKDELAPTSHRHRLVERFEAWLLVSCQDGAVVLAGCGYFVSWKGSLHAVVWVLDIALAGENGLRRPSLLPVPGRRYSSWSEGDCRSNAVCGEFVSAEPLALL